MKRLFTLAWLCFSTLVCAYTNIVHLALQLFKSSYATIKTNPKMQKCPSIISGKSPMSDDKEPENPNNKIAITSFP